jgi:hypothetical protein
MRLLLCALSASAILVGCGGPRSTVVTLEYTRKADEQLDKRYKTIGFKTNSKEIEFISLSQAVLMHNLAMSDYESADLKVNINVAEPVIQNLGGGNADVHSSGTNVVGKVFWNDFKYSQKGIIRITSSDNIELLNEAVDYDREINYGFRVIKNVPLSGSYDLEKYGSGKSYYSPSELSFSIKNNWEGILSSCRSGSSGRYRSVIHDKFVKKYQDTKALEYIYVMKADDPEILKGTSSLIKSGTPNELKAELSKYLSVKSGGYINPKDNATYEADVVDAIKYNTAVLHFKLGEIENASNELAGLSAGDNAATRKKPALISSIETYSQSVKK